MTIEATMLAEEPTGESRGEEGVRDGAPGEGAEGPSSEELARRVGGGCAESFAVLVARHGAVVFNYLLQMTRHRQDAEDLTQETFLKVFRALGRAAPPLAFRAWLLTIARRTAYNHFRAARAAEELDAETESAVPDPAAAMEVSDDRSALWGAARRLKPHQFEALWLRYAEELSVQEVASVMRLHSIHVRVLLHRGRQQLRRRLSPALHPAGARSSIPQPPNLRRVP